jgi:hypothetical protein
MLAKLHTIFNWNITLCHHTVDRWLSCWHRWTWTTSSASSHLYVDVEKEVVFCLLFSELWDVGNEKEAPSSYRFETCIKWKLDESYYILYVHWILPKGSQRQHEKTEKLWKIMSTIWAWHQCDLVSGKTRNSRLIRNFFCWITKNYGIEFIISDGRVECFGAEIKLTIGKKTMRCVWNKECDKDNAKLYILNLDAILIFEPYYSISKPV